MIFCHLGQGYAGQKETNAPTYHPAGSALLNLCDMYTFPRTLGGCVCVWYLKDRLLFVGCVCVSVLVSWYFPLLFGLLS